MRPTSRSSTQHSPPVPQLLITAASHTSNSAFRDFNVCAPEAWSPGAEGRDHVCGSEQAHPRAATWPSAYRANASLPSGSSSSRLGAGRPTDGTRRPARLPPWARVHPVLNCAPHKIPEQIPRSQSGNQLPRQRSGTRRGRPPTPDREAFRHSATCISSVSQLGRPRPRQRPDTVDARAQVSVRVGRTERRPNSRLTAAFEYMAYANTPSEPNHPCSSTSGCFVRVVKPYRNGNRMPTP